MNHRDLVMPPHLPGSQPWSVVKGELVMDNEKFVRSVYQIAEDMDIPGFIALFTDGTSVR